MYDICGFEMEVYHCFRSNLKLSNKHDEFLKCVHQNTRIHTYLLTKLLIIGCIICMAYWEHFGNKYANIFQYHTVKHHTKLVTQWNSQQIFKKSRYMNIYKQNLINFPNIIGHKPIFLFGIEQVVWSLQTPWTKT